MQLKAQSATLSATAAVVHERRRISRDLHDSTIQPYLGLKLGLEALRLRLAATDPVAREVDELIHMAGEGITELRRYVGKLRRSYDAAPRQSVVQGVRWQARAFSEVYGLKIEVLAERDVIVPGRLFEELLHIAREALSNIRRHTDARHAVVTLRVERRVLILEFENEGGAPEFRPRSIEERARELCGRVRVWQNAAGNTVVGVQVPL